MVPQAVPVQPGPDTAQFTAVLVVPVTLAVKLAVVLMLALAVEGDTVTAIGVTGVLMVTVAAPDFVRSAWEVAVTTTLFGEGATAGAV